MCQWPTRCSFQCSAKLRIAISPSHAEPDGPEELESGPVSEWHGATGNDTDPAPEEEDDELHPEGSLGIEELNAEANRLLQLISLQNSGIDSDLPDREPQATPETSNSDHWQGPSQ